MKTNVASRISRAAVFALVIGGAAFAQGPQVNGKGTHDEAYVELAEKTVPSVVNISTVSTIQAPPPGSPEEFFRKFFGDSLNDEGGLPPLPSHPGGGSAMRATALGTGFVIESSSGSALILTNNHVVQGADEIQVTFTEVPGEKAAEGEVVGRDLELDVALIRVQTDRTLKPLRFGDSDTLKVGEQVAAIGNPFGQGHSITHGIISAKGRMSPDFPLLNYLQTDAPINPGNSGGPLLDMSGAVIGVNNAILAQAQGIGFAIPINLVKSVLPQLKTKGTVERGYIGVLVDETTPEIAPKLGVGSNETSPFVTHVFDGSPADEADLRPYDVIDEFNGKVIARTSDLIKEVIAVPVGKSVPVKVMRDGKLRTLNIRIAQRPSVEEDETQGGQQQSGQLPKEKEEGQTGLSIRPLTPEISRRLGLPLDVRGVIVSTVHGNGPGEKAGLVRGDVIMEVDRKKVTDVDAFRHVVRDKGNYLLRVRRPTPEGSESIFVAMLEVP